MPIHIALLRSVNVKPRWVKMERLREVMSDAGYGDVATHIQSGNVRFTAPGTAGSAEQSLADSVSSLLSAEFGFDIPVILRRPVELTELVEAYDALVVPDLGMTAADVRAYVVFLGREPTTDFATAITAWSLPGERARVVGRHVVCWYARPSHSASLPTHRIWRTAGVPVTSRDLKVARALAGKWGA